MKIDLHLVSWNRPKMTELVVRTVHRNTKRDNFRLVVWDNGSKKSTRTMLQDMADNGLIDELILSPRNIGLEGARQALLLEHTESEYFVCVDNDCLPQKPEGGKDWLERLTGLMTDNKQYAAIAMRTQVMIGTGNIFEEADKFKDNLVDFPHPGGSFRIMKTASVMNVAGWDLERAGRGAEERYVCGKLRDAGYHTAFATDVRCLHLFGNRAQTKERWGYEEDMKPEDTGHSDISHPALTNGDDFEEVKAYCGEELAKEYFNA